MKKIESVLQKTHLRLDDMQEFHLHLDRAKGFDTDFMRNVGYLAAEVGEMANAYRKWSKSSAESGQIEAHAHLAEELADVLAYILKLANYADVDLEAAYIKKMMHNINRTWEGIDREP